MITFTAKKDGTRKPLERIRERTPITVTGNGRDAIFKGLIPNLTNGKHDFDFTVTTNTGRTFRELRKGVSVSH